MERPGEGALREREKSNGGKNIDRKAQWVGINGRMIDRAVDIRRRPEQVGVPAESMDDIISNIFWKRGGALWCLTLKLSTLMRDPTCA